jgi:hypothetical protein
METVTQPQAEAHISAKTELLLGANNIGEMRR